MRPCCFNSARAEKRLFKRLAFRSGESAQPEIHDLERIDAQVAQIVVYGSDPVLIRRRTLHEIVQLAKVIVHTEDRRYRFIERVYTATKLP